MFVKVLKFAPMGRPPVPALFPYRQHPGTRTRQARGNPQASDSTPNLHSYRLGLCQSRWSVPLDDRR